MKYVAYLDLLISHSLTEPTVGPSNINATALTAFEIQVSWEPVQQLSANGILRGYEVMNCINTHLDVCPTEQTVTDELSKLGCYDIARKKWKRFQELRSLMK